MDGNASTVFDARRRFARRELDDLLAEARAELAAAESGDLAAIYGAHRALNQAVVLMLTNRLDAA